MVSSCLKRTSRLRGLGIRAARGGMLLSETIKLLYQGCASDVGTYRLLRRHIPQLLWGRRTSREVRRV
jgi:hypothetical protein